VEGGVWSAAGRVVWVRQGRLVRILRLIESGEFRTRILEETMPLCQVVGGLGH